MAGGKITTVEKLAELAQNEFVRIEGKVDDGFRSADDKFKTVVDILDIIRDDVHDIKITLGPLVRSTAALEETVRIIMDKRVTRSEEKAGLSR